MRTVEKRPQCRSKRERQSVFFGQVNGVLTGKTCGSFLLAHGVHRQLSHVFLRLQVNSGMKVYDLYSSLASFIHIYWLFPSLYSGSARDMNGQRAQYKDIVKRDRYFFVRGLKKSSTTSLSAVSILTWKTMMQSLGEKRQNSVVYALMEMDMQRVVIWI